MRQTFVTNTTNSPCLLECNGATHKIKCKVCNRAYVVHQCTKFSKMTIEKRIEAMKKRQLCLNCLLSDNRKAERCRVNNKPHNQFASTRRDESLSQGNQRHRFCYFYGIPVNMLMAIAIVRFLDRMQDIDIYSSGNFITKNFAARLRLPKNHAMKIESSNCS